MKKTISIVMAFLIVMSVTSLVSAFPYQQCLQKTGQENMLVRWMKGGCVGESSIYDNGFIGIGTTSPEHLVDIYNYGDASMRIKTINDGSGFFADLILDGDVLGGGASRVRFFDDGEEKAFVGDVNGNDLELWTLEDEPIYFITNRQQRMMINEKIEMKAVLRLEERNNVLLAQKGDLYTHSSGALCFYNGDAWERLNRKGYCS